MSVAALDESVALALAALHERSVPRPDLLLWMGTGVGKLPNALSEAEVWPLHEIAGVPAGWTRVALHAGKLGGLFAWLLDDLGADPELDPSGSPWERGFPAWLAAAAGAVAMVHVSAGAAASARAPRPGGLALGSDHLDLSGASPLLGLGTSALGPLFPDLSRLHRRELRESALALARALEIDAAEAVLACTAGPSRETPAEREALARLGADVGVQGLSGPLLAAGHAGLAVLAIAAVVESGAGPLDLPSVVAAAERAAPDVERLVLALVDELGPCVRALRAERDEA